AELAEFLEMDKEEIVLAMEACQTPAYIQDVLPGEEREHLSLLDRITNDDGNTHMLEEIALREALRRLDGREREVILRRFFRDETQAVIAADLDVSQVQVSRIEKAALIKLKGILE
ncbi:MAG: sigma-70 family RNA polymerase sigma factor, partial [Bacillota bacterium]|nr:sigma-70 family RNA polymerase sigma factor [Bacillota bacterium]